MELREFLKSSLIEIIDAVHDAAQHAKSKGAEINPYTADWREDQGHLIIHDTESKLLMSLVEFDIAVTSGEDTERGVGGGIKVMGMTIGASAQAEWKERSQSVSRIKFSVPLALPSSKPKPENANNKGRKKK